ncbi:alpha/beta fold hydrolase [Capillimicrobium parvum]|nr:alpha/beta hydrolase [Capillimicrobium parvum]
MIATRRGDFLIEQRGPTDAPAIVLVAGLGDDHDSWAGPAAVLARSHRVITFDNRGIGRSPIPPGPYSTAEMAEDVHGLVSELGLGRVNAAGSSMGGAICQEWVLAYPDDVDRLVLSNTWAERDRWLTGLLEHWIELAGRGSGRDLLFQLALFCFSADHLTDHPQTIDEFLDAPLPSLDGFRAAARACQRHEALDRLASLRTPTLIIGGEHDILTRPTLSQRLAQTIPAAELRWLPTGHMTFWEQPDAWTTAVREFLAARP